MVDGWMDVEQSGYIRRGLLSGIHLIDDFFLFVGLEFWPATANMPLLACSSRPLPAGSRSIARSNSAKGPTIRIIKLFPRDCYILLTLREGAEINRLTASPVSKRKGNHHGHTFPLR
jgi:hypothetical protein